MIAGGEETELCRELESKELCEEEGKSFSDSSFVPFSVEKKEFKSRDMEEVPPPDSKGAPDSSGVSCKGVTSLDDERPRSLLAGETIIDEEMDCLS